MKIIFKKAVVNAYKIINEDTKKKEFDAVKRSVMGNKYSVLKNGIKVASIEKNAYNLMQSSIILGKEILGTVECDWTNRLTINLKNKWYISKTLNGYNIRSYGKILAKVECKYGLANKYIVDVVDEGNLLSIVSFILALDIINYEVER